MKFARVNDLTGLRCSVLEVVSKKGASSYIKVEQEDESISYVYPWEVTPIYIIPKETD